MGVKLPKRGEGADAAPIVMLVAPPAVTLTRKFSSAGPATPFFDRNRMARDPVGMASFPGENLAVMSIKASCEAAGVAVVAINGQTAQHRSVDETFRAMLGAVNGASPSLIGFTGTPELFLENAELATQAKARWPETKTILGHDFATLNWRQLLERHPEFDFACHGEGERVFEELARALAEGRDLADVRNLARRDSDGRAHLNERATPLVLDELPWPARDDLAPVLALGMSASVFTSRGCVFRCVYCSTGATAGLLRGKQSYRTKSVDNVVDEIELLVRDYSIEHVTITDDLFVTRSSESRARAEAFARELIRRKLDVKFMFDCRIDSFDFDLFRLLRDAGLHRVFIGVETGSDEQLRAYRKVYDGSQGSQGDVVRKTLADLDALGIGVIPGLITYHPDVTREELRKMLEFLELKCGWSRSAGPFGFRAKAYPGTPLFDDYQRRGLLTNDWPIGEWRFSDPRAQRHYSRVADAIRHDYWDYAGVRDIFVRGLDEWDNGLPPADGGDELPLADHGSTPVAV